MIIILQRIISSDNGTFGVLVKDDKPFLVTLELPWKENQPNASCIQTGAFKCIKIYSQKFNKELYVLENVPGRGNIEIHIGNTIKDTHGCILLGMQYNLTNYAISISAPAFDSFMKMMPPDGFILDIRPPCISIETVV